MAAPLGEFTTTGEVLQQDYLVIIFLQMIDTKNDR